MEYQSEHIRRLAHDEKNHLLVIKGMPDKNQVNDYIDKIYDDLQEYSSTAFSGYKQLDVLLNRYKIQCEAENISFETSITTTDFSRISDTDLVSLMSNILDNAVEAAKNSKEKRIYLSINKTMGLNAIKCVNSCDNQPTTQKGKLVTTKKDKHTHGFGTKIIEDITNKYDGIFSWHFDEDKKEFTMMVSVK